MMKEAYQLFFFLVVLVSSVSALVGPMRTKGVQSSSPLSYPAEPTSFSRNLVALDAKKKKRRRRKQAPKADDVQAAPATSATVAESKAAEPVVEKPAPAIAKEAAETVSTPPPSAPATSSDDEDAGTEEDMSNILEVASFKFEPDDAITKGTRRMSFVTKD